MSASKKKTAKAAPKKDAADNSGERPALPLSKVLLMSDEEKQQFRDARGITYDG